MSDFPHKWRVCFLICSENYMYRYTILFISVVLTINSSFVVTTRSTGEVSFFNTFSPDYFNPLKITNFLKLK